MRPIMSAMLVVAEVTRTVCRSRLAIRSLTIKPRTGIVVRTPRLDVDVSGRRFAYQGEVVDPGRWRRAGAGLGFGALVDAAASLGHRRHQQDPATLRVS